MSESVMERIEKLEQRIIKSPKNKGCKKTLLVVILLALFVGFCGFVIYAQMSGLNKDASSGSGPASLLQPLEVIQGNGELTGPLKKYYFNVGLRSDPLLQECQGPQLKRSFPDMDYALLGYDILKGYPLSIGHDPGFTLPIFTADYRAGSQTADCRYSVPKGIVLIPDVSCITSFSSEVVETKYEFSKSLAVSASVSGGGWGVSFSASAGYKESASEMSTGESVFILSRASCNYYYMRLLEDDAPPFHPVFEKWLLKLDRTNQDLDYINFFETYGTHFLREVTFGASFTYEHKMNAKTYKTQREESVNVAVQASYSGAFSVGGGFNMDSDQRQSASEFRKSVTTRTITVGAAPPANGDAMTWASTVKETPVPVKYKLASIEQLFTDKFMKRNENSVDYKRIANKIAKMKVKYCEFLRKEGLLDSCAALSPGLRMKGVEFRGSYAQMKITSMSKCIDECFKRTDCVAVDFCVACSTNHPQHNVCFMYKESRDGVRAIEREDVESNIILAKLEKELVFSNTAINGIQRALTNDNITTVRQCFAHCLQDVYCVAFTFCTCPEKDQMCTLYSEDRLSLVTEEGTDTHVISPRVKDVNEVYTRSQG